MEGRSGGERTIDKKSGASKSSNCPISRRDLLFLSYSARFRSTLLPLRELLPRAETRCSSLVHAHVPIKFCCCEGCDRLQNCLHYASQTLCEAGDCVIILIFFVPPLFSMQKDRKHEGEIGERPFWLIRNSKTRKKHRGP